METLKLCYLRLIGNFEALLSAVDSEEKRVISVRKEFTSLQENDALKKRQLTIRVN